MRLSAGSGDHVSPDALDAAARALAEGELVGLPTDTVYGLAADPFQAPATERLFEAKCRPADVSLPLLVAGVDDALSVATAVPDVARALMDRFWPGPLTIVLPSRPDLGANLGSDEATVGVRCPGHPVPLGLCAVTGPLATTSANLHGQPPLETADAVAATFGDLVAVVLDGGTCTGSPSTVVDCTGAAPKLLREGRIPWSELRAAIR